MLRMPPKIFTSAQKWVIWRASSSSSHHIPPYQGWIHTSTSALTIIAIWTHQCASLSRELIPGIGKLDGVKSVSHIPETRAPFTSSWKDSSRRRARPWHRLIELRLVWVSLKSSPASICTARRKLTSWHNAHLQVGRKRRLPTIGEPSHMFNYAVVIPHLIFSPDKASISPRYKDRSSRNNWRISKHADTTSQLSSLFRRTPKSWSLFALIYQPHLLPYAAEKPSYETLYYYRSLRSLDLHRELA